MVESFVFFSRGASETSGALFFVSKFGNKERLSYLWDMNETNTTPSKPNRPTPTQWTYTNLGNGTQDMTNDEFSFVIG